LALRWSWKKHFNPLTWVLTSTGMESLGACVLLLTLPWFVLATTGSASQAGLVVFAEMGASVAARFLAGPVVDRMGLRRVSLVAGVVETSSVVLIALLVVTDRLSFPALLALVAVGGAGNATGLLAKGFLAPEAAKYVGVDESRGISLSSVMVNVGRVCGPSAGAFLAAWEPVAGLAVVALLFAVSCLIVGLALPNGMEPGPVRAGHGEERQGYWRSLGQGIGYFCRDGLLVRHFAMFVLMSFLVAPMAGVFVPLWAKETTASPEAIGLLITVGAFASLVGSVVAVPVIDRVRPSVILAVGYLLLVPQLLTLALGAPMWLAMVVWAVAGFAGAFPPPLVEKISYRWPSEEFRSRVRSLGGAVVPAGSALGNLAGGLAVERFGLTVPLIAATVLYLLVTQGLGLRKDMRRLTPEIRRDRPQEAPR
jgi:MFS family permease